MRRICQALVAVNRAVGSRVLHQQAAHILVQRERPLILHDGLQAQALCAGLAHLNGLRVALALQGGR